MKTLYTKHAAKIKRLKVKYTAIQDKHPDFNFKNSELRRDITKFMEIQKDLIYAEVDAKACKSNNPDLMCTGCNCWKQTRANCS